MIRISSQENLLETFRELDRHEVIVPPQMKFPLIVRDYMSWIEPSGHRVYLVVADPTNNKPLGVVFQRTRGSNETHASMCQWCHAVRSGSSVGLLTAAAGRDHRVGVHLCVDLNCKENALSTPGIHDFQESLTGRERLARVVERMTEFARRNLF